MRNPAIYNTIIINMKVLLNDFLILQQINKYGISSKNKTNI